MKDSAIKVSENDAVNAIKEQMQLEEIERRNHSAIGEIFKVLQMVKGFECSYDSPYKGRMLVSLNGKLFLMELDQLPAADGLTVEEQVKKYKFLLK